MGCDIHTYREVKRNGQWETLETSYEENEGTDAEPEIRTYLDPVHISRNYWLFGFLSKRVRTEWSFSLEARGLPEDVSAPVQAESDFWGPDGHSHSWLTLEELRLKATELTLLPDPAALKFLPEITDFLSCLTWPEDVQPADCRVVFWFDN